MKSLDAAIAIKQTEESGYTTQDQAIDRLTEVYAEKRAAPSNHAPS